MNLIPIVLVTLPLLVGCSSTTGGEVFAERHEDGQGKSPLSKEVRALHQKAEQGDAEAQLRLGAMYIDGRGVTKDVTKALEWYHKSADQGYVKAQNVLGWVYGQGLGVPSDHEEAVKWLRKAADQGSVPARVALGTYRFKSLLDKTLGQPMGIAQTQYKLGTAYADGRGVAKDPKEAVKWLLKSAEKGYPAAQHRLGDMHCAGQGTPRDTVRGYAWFSVAARNGYLGSGEKREALAKKMTKEQIAQAQEMSRGLVKEIAPLPKK